jgi:peptidoglycan DL-endopeptidase CwlO
VSHVPTRPSGSGTLIGNLWRRGAAVPLGLLAVGALVLSVGGSATAAPQAPQPTVAQAQARLTQLNNQAQQLDQAYDAAQQALTSASQQLAAINTEVARDKAKLKVIGVQVARIATQEYEDGVIMQSPEALLTSTKPQQILDQASMLTELSTFNSQAVNQYVLAAKQLSGAQDSAQRAEDGKLAIAKQLQGEKNKNGQLIAQQKALIAQLTPQEVAAAGGPGTGTVVHGSIPTATNAQAQEAIDFAFAQIGCPYVFGGTGPCADGFDCSGLTMEAWAHAGVSIPRTSYEQAGLPAVSTSDMQPGDLVLFFGDGHVAIYVGGGMVIHAPQAGENVQEIAISSMGSPIDGVVRP